MRKFTEKNNKAGPAKLKRSRGFVLLFSVAISGIILSIALGLANVVFKELSFATSARSSNDAFFAADVGAECALLHDKTTAPSFPKNGPATAISCGGASITPGYSSSGGGGIYQFTVSGLANSGNACAIVTVEKSSSDATTITSRGYNIGDSSCVSTAINRVERRLLVTYGQAPTPP